MQSFFLFSFHLSPSLDQGNFCWGQVWGLTYLSVPDQCVMSKEQVVLVNAWNVLLCLCSVWDRLHLVLAPVTFP